jgi:hypothetical protein
MTKCPGPWGLPSRSAGVFGCNHRRCTSRMTSNSPYSEAIASVWLRQPGQNQGAGVLTHHAYRTVDKDHGRIETRYYHVLAVPEELAQRHSVWEGLRSFGMVCSERQIGDPEPTSETRFFITWDWRRRRGRCPGKRIAISNDRRRDLRGRNLGGSALERLAFSRSAV